MRRLLFRTFEGAAFGSLLLMVVAAVLWAASATDLRLVDWGGPSRNGQPGAYYLIYGLEGRVGFISLAARPAVEFQIERTDGTFVEHRPDADSRYPTPIEILRPRRVFSFYFDEQFAAVFLSAPVLIGVFAVLPVAWALMAITRRTRQTTIA